MLAALGPVSSLTGHNNSVYGATNQRYSGADCQVGVETADRDRFPPDDGSERDTEKECTVVPSEHTTAARREVVCQTGLLSREEQLGDRGAQSEGNVDQYLGMERKA